MTDVTAGVADSGHNAGCYGGKDEDREQSRRRASPVGHSMPSPQFHQRESAGDLHQENGQNGRAFMSLNQSYGCGGILPDGRLRADAAKECRKRQESDAGENDKRSSLEVIVFADK
jgi:hypothetical protein